MIFVLLEALAPIIVKVKDLLIILTKKSSMLRKIQKRLLSARLWWKLCRKMLIGWFLVGYRLSVRKIKVFGLLKMRHLENCMTIWEIITPISKLEFMDLLQLVHLYLTQIWMSCWLLTPKWLLLMIFSLNWQSTLRLKAGSLAVSQS